MLPARLIISNYDGVVPTIQYPRHLTVTMASQTTSQVIPLVDQMLIFFQNGRYHVCIIGDLALVTDFFIYKEQ